MCANGHLTDNKLAVRRISYLIIILIKSFIHFLPGGAALPLPPLLRHLRPPHRECPPRARLHHGGQSNTHSDSLILFN